MEKKTVRRTVYDMVLTCDNHGRRLSYVDDCTLTRNKAIRKLYDALQMLSKYQREHIYEASVLKYVIEVDPDADVLDVCVNTILDQYFDGREPEVCYRALVPTIPDTEWLRVFGKNAC